MKFKRSYSIARNLGSAYKFAFGGYNEVLIKIEGASYASNKEKHNDYLWFHPYVAKKRFINLYSTGKFD